MLNNLGNPKYGGINKSIWYQNRGINLHISGGERGGGARKDIYFELNNFDKNSEPKNKNKNNSVNTEWK